MIGLARSLPTPPQPPQVAPTPALHEQASIYVVDDPHGTMRLIGLRGSIDLRAVAEVADAVDVRGLMELVHIDLSGAEIAAERAIECLEATFDRAEQRGIRLRVVGLDPEHPALLRRTTR